MRILRDTHLLLWAIAARLSQLLDPANEVYYSAASVWEIAIKRGLRRTRFRIDTDALLDALPASGFLELPISARHAAGVARLPPIHKDPFDRMLVAQSMTEPMTLYTNDRMVNSGINQRPCAFDRYTAMLYLGLPPRLVGRMGVAREVKDRVGSHAGVR